LILALFFSLLLFIFDREDRGDDRGLWGAGLWFLIIGSRRVSLWFSPSSGIWALPIDEVFLFTLEATALIILIKRGVRLGEWIRLNKSIACFFAFGILSVLWSSDPLLSSKALIKELGQPLMAVLVLTERRSHRAAELLMRRCAYLLVPLSIVLIKYLPSLGREFSEWGGAENTGVTTGKNQLGLLCLVLGLYFVWATLQACERIGKTQLVNVTFLLMIAWLLYRANSATATISIIIGILIILLLRRNIIRKAQRLGLYFVGLLCISGLLLATNDFGNFVIDTAGREETFAGRQRLWRDLIELHDAPIIGAGYASFWLQPKVQVYAESFFWKPNQAHNGFLEIYLNLGLVGLLLLVAILVSVFKNCQLILLQQPHFGQLAIALFAVAVLRSIMEATFQGLGLLWFTFFLVGTRTAQTSANSESEGAARCEADSRRGKVGLKGKSACFDPYSPR